MTKKHIYLTEKQIAEIKSRLLSESTRDNLLLPYLNILQQKGQNVTLGELKVYLMRKFVTEANIHALSQNSNYYLAGVARYYFNGDLTSNKQLNVFYPRVTDRFIPDVCSRLDEIILYLRNAYIDNRGMSFEQPEDFGTLSLQQLFRKYGDKIDKLKQKYAVLDNPQDNKKKTINPKISKNYNIDIMYSFDDCRKYNTATSPGAWCITYGQQHYNGYTRNNTSHFVIFAKNGYESIPRQVGKGFPLDEYGLSLIAVQQSNTDGSFVCATTRWNHGGYGGAPNVPNADHALTYEQLKSVTGLSDEKFQEIFNVWKENAVTKKSNDRLAGQRDKIDVIRKFKYVEILLRNGSTLEQLRQDNRLQHARLLYPFNEDMKVLPKINKSILSIGIVENQRTYWTILDRGVVKVDEILCDTIEPGKSKEGWHGWETKHGNSFAVCTKNDKSYLYFYNNHKLLEIDGNKAWWGVEDLNESLSRIDVQEGTGYKAHTPYMLWDFSRNIPIVMPNGRTISETTSYDDIALARKSNRVVYMIGDSAAKQYYYFDKETKRFIEELNGYAIYRYIEAQNLLTLCDANKAKDNSMWGMQDVPKILFNTNTLQVIHPCGIETFYDAAKLDAYGFMGGKGIDEAVDIFTHQYISINTSNEIGAKSLFLYDAQKDDALRYPNGDVVRFVRSDIKRQHGIIVMALPNAGYSWGKCVIYNIPERRFYQNEDGSLIFYWQGENKIKDKYHVERELPFSTFGPYWYEQHKDIELENVDKLLAEGTDPNEIFDSIKENVMPKYKDYKIVSLNGVMNIYVESANRLLLNEWEEDIDNFYCDCALVKRIDNADEYYHSEKFNYVNTNGELLLKEDIGYGEPFLVEFQRAIVRQYSYGAWNLIDTTGKYMNHFGFQKIHAPSPKWLCYKTTPINKRKDRYLSINGNIFDSYMDAYEDSLHGTPEIDKYEAARQAQVAESKQKRTIYLTENQVSEIQQKIEQARKDTDKNPTEKQKQAGNYKLGRVRVLGYDIAIENPRGSIRSGKDKNGNKWQVKMKNDYGYFTHTLGYDGDAVDVFLGDNFDTYSIFAVDQKIDGEFDETKIMLGFKNEQEAKEAYMSNFNPGWKGFWKITEVPHTVFQKWLYDGYQQKKPFFEYADVKKAKLNEGLENGNEYITLYHSTTYANLASILNSGIMRIDMPHKEGHGDMLWFSTKPNDYGNEIEISIKVPQSEFGNDYTSFEFVNKNHVVISRNLSLVNYRPSIELFALSMPGYIVYFKKDRIQRYIDGMPNGALEEEVFEVCDKLREENSDFNTILDFVENNPTLLS